jgi:hypothetical protein
MMFPSRKRNLRTAFGAGKRARCRQSREAIQKRWKSACSASSEDEDGDQHGQEQNSNQPQGGAELRFHLLGRQLLQDGGGTDSGRCFMELDTLRLLLAAVACSGCGSVGSLGVSFGDKMGY